MPSLPDSLICDPDVSSRQGRVVVLDNGTGLTKAGFSGDPVPRISVPCIVSRKATADASQDAPVVGDPSTGDAWSWPMRDGLVHNWSDMQLVWEHAWDLLDVDPSASRLLLTDSALTPTTQRQQLLEVMLETFGFKGVNLQVQAVLTLYAHGLQTGVVMDSGDGVSHAVSVVDGYAFSHLTKRLPVAGRHVTEHLVELLLRRGYSLSRSADLEHVRSIKELHGYVAFDLEREHKLARETTCLVRSYKLPDGRVIKVGAERFMAPEVLFNPTLLDLEQPGIAAMVFGCVNDCDIDNRRRLYEHVVVSGGTTMFPGLTTRMEKELRELYVKHTLKGDVASLKLKLNVHDCPSRRHMVFKGAAVLAQIMADADQFWITKQDWAEDPHRAMAKMGGC